MAQQEGIVAGIGREIEAHLPQEMQALLRVAGELAAREEQRLYLVGGVVRDLLLGRPNLDIDLVVEGNAPALARQLAKSEGGVVVTHPRFGTANYKQGTVSLDLVTARLESYERPGALPTVAPGTIEDDLFRRDFTVNAMAARLDPTRFGELVDPYGGKRDLDSGLIRVLQGESFRDDPTRIWRALRYEQRLGFRLESGTESLLRRDLGIMSEVSADRLRHELELVLKEEYPEKVLSRAHELGVLQQLYPLLEVDGWLVERFFQAREASPDSKPEAILYLSLMAWRLSPDDTGDFIKRLKFRGAEARVLRDVHAVKQALPQIAEQGLLPSTVYSLLECHQPQVIMAAVLATDSALVRERLELYLSKWRFVRPSLGGDDLKRMGVPVGRRLGWLLRALLEARLDGKVTTREDEQALVSKWLSEGVQRGG
ncbi:CCA tRNA nucleotidyltransferase [Chloroflexota bacterium]